MGLQGKNIIIGVTGGIAAYKALELTRLLRKAGAEVWPVMTKAAAEFVTPLSFSTLAGSPVSVDTFDRTHNRGVNHINIADNADLLVVVPATANIIGKIAGGIADDLLSTVIMATDAPNRLGRGRALIAPAMNHRMYRNPIVQANIDKLTTLGYEFIGPERGELACGWEGDGRLAPVGEIFNAIEGALSAKDMEGERVLISAGATRTAIDPVRFISNASTGRMGVALAAAAHRRGAEVTLVVGDIKVAPPSGVELVRAESSSAMQGELKRRFENSTTLIMAAAVADFQVAEERTEKIKKGSDGITLNLVKTSDILAGLAQKKNDRIVVGFALESEDLEHNATSKLKAKGLDLIVANTPDAIGSEMNKAVLIGKGGCVEALPPMTKAELADIILDKVVSIKKGQAETVTNG
ncbi:Phosphopantothenoylcysteine decarboxylase / Phosphopantothenoylcysteine synthetase [hydrothermal vent metagenome]|uniref:Phosphopantothenoylcysteine decarboxylase / Phosphopantothenoylcysteine synthetase n=1 Tax=hydrothermal vent metagenome TaxID=652676 RepID=A0A3B0R5V7_9ZZZZ